MYEFIDRPVSSLDRGGHFLIWTMRTWARSVSQSHCPAGAIVQAFSKWRMIAGLQPFHRAMLILNRDALQTVRFCSLGCNHISEDEALILTLLASLRDRGASWARDTLTLLIEEDSVGDMLGALTDLSRSLAEASLLPRMPAAQPDEPRAREG